MPTTVALAYTIDIQPPQLQSAIQAKLAAVVLDTASLVNIGVTLLTDVVTVPNPTQLIRTLTFSLVAPFIPQPVVASENATYKGAIVSSSNLDTFFCVVRFTDSAGKPGFENVTLTGTTPVIMIVGDKKIITSIDIDPSITPVGMISVFNQVAVNPITVEGKTTITPLFVRGDLTAVILKNSTGSIVSTSDADTFPAGDGARVVALTYTDDTSNVHSESVNLNGTTPVNLPNANLATITNAGVFASGSVTGNVGTITFWSGPNATGALLGTIPPSFYSYFPNSSDQKAPFRELYSFTLSAALQSQLTASPPLLA